MTDAERHSKILNQMHEIYVAKNSDYGNSFSAQFQEFGILSSVIRLQDKMLRLKSLAKKGLDGQLLKSESIIDTLIDLANYSIMTAMELDKLKFEDDDLNDLKAIYRHNIKVKERLDELVKLTEPYMNK